MASTETFFLHFVHLNKVICTLMRLIRAKGGKESDLIYLTEKPDRLDRAAAAIAGLELGGCYFVFRGCFLENDTAPCSFANIPELRRYDPGLPCGKRRLEYLLEHPHFIPEDLEYTRLFGGISRDGKEVLYLERSNRGTRQWQVQSTAADAIICDRQSCAIRLCLPEEIRME